MIKNFHEKKEREWQRMYGKPEADEDKSLAMVEERQREREPGGFMGWVKNILKKKNP